MGKIGFINVCHSDYVNDDVHFLASQAVDALKSCGNDVVAIQTPIVDMDQATEQAKELVKADVDGVVVFLGTWIESHVCMSVIREIEHLPFCLWGFPMYEKDGKLESTGSYVSYAMFKGSLDRAGYRYKAILGNITDNNTTKALSEFSSVATAYSKLKRSKVLLVGYTSMGIYPGTFDHLFMRTKIGPEVLQMDSYSVINRAESQSVEDRQKAAEIFTRLAKTHDNVEQYQLEKAGGIYLALEQLADEMKLDAVNVKCQYEFSKEYKMVPCVPLSALAEKGVVTSCEGDILNTVSMLILKYLSNQVIGYGDAMNHYDNVVKLSSCGFMPFSLGIKEEQTIRSFVNCPGFNGLLSSCVMRPEKVTVMRLIEDCGDYHILYFTGQGLPTELRQGFMPALDVKLDGNVEDLVKNYSGQHFAICYGDQSQKIEDLAKILNIKTVRV